MNDRKGLLVRKADIHKETIDAKKKTIFIVPNIMGLDEKNNYAKIITNYLNANCYNILIAERNLKTAIKYKLTMEAFSNIIADYILELLTKTKEPHLDIHFLAYQSGAEIAAKAARRIETEKNHKINRITALSPTYDQDPRDENLILKTNDADFVDVTHTYLTDRKEKADMGHVDFYPNGGLVQPGCEKEEGNIFQNTFNRNPL